MKYFSFLLFLICCLTLNTVHAAQGFQKFPIGLDKPFKVLHFPEEWKIIEANESMLMCEHEDDDKVNFEFVVGKKLSSKDTLDKLEREISDYISGKSKTVPLIAYSLDLEMENDESDLEVNSRLANSHLERETINGIEWIKFQGESVLEIGYSYSDGEEWTEEFPLTQWTYCTILNKRLYIVDFDALTEDFETYLPLFIKTMNNLYK